MKLVLMFSLMLVSSMAFSAQDFYIATQLTLDNQTLEEAQKSLEGRIWGAATRKCHEKEKNYPIMFEDKIKFKLIKDDELLLFGAASFDCY